MKTPKEFLWILQIKIRCVYVMHVEIFQIPKIKGRNAI